MVIPQGREPALVARLRDGHAGRAVERFRVLTLVDDFTRECLGLVVDTSLTALRVVRELGSLVEAEAALA